MYTKDSIYYFSQLEKYPQLIHAISTQAAGPITENGLMHEENLIGFLKKLTLERNKVVFCEQVHGGNSLIVTSTDHGILPESDGLITFQRNIFLGIRTADCLPVLFYDPVLDIVGNVHAGYKGLLSGILENSIMHFQELGSKIEDILVGIGPGIGICCYYVPEERIKLFFEKFPFLSDFSVYKKNRYYLDISKIAEEVIKRKGIRRENIENARICTHDTDDFFSYRRGNPTIQTFLSIIGMKKL